VGKKLLPDRELAADRHTSPLELVEEGFPVGYADRIYPPGTFSNHFVGILSSPLYAQT
jgi:hypothetical protein